MMYHMLHPQNLLIYQKLEAHRQQKIILSDLSKYKDKYDKKYKPMRKAYERLKIKLERREKVLLSIINNLPDINKCSIKLRYFENKSLEEVAEEIRVNVKSVHYKIHSGICKIRKSETEIEGLDLKFWGV